MAGPRVGQREEYAQRLDDALAAVVTRLSSLPEVERVILFGSYAEGRRDLFTDLDLLVVMRTEEGFLERSRRLYGLLAGLGVDLDLLAYTPEELDENRDRPFFRRALAGKVVYEKRG